ncbi:MAG: TrkA C-terminal domain-containing protein, partial [Paramuribaculum sp.]|nr:TrkA C-terminal domain-containing protein [Paramuribaculum sp.]
GEFAFIIATLGMSLGVLDPTIYPIVVAVSVLTTFTTPYFIRMADPVYNGLVKILPKRLHFLIDRYCDRATNESETGLLWKSVLNRYLWRVMLYTVVLITISLISINWLLPWLVKFNPVWGKLICALVTIAAMGPFLLALSMPASKRTERQRLLAANAHFDVPLIVMTIFRMIVALIIVIFLLARIYSAWVGVVFGFIVFAILIFGFSKQLKKKMRGLESRFIDNLNERELRRSGKKNNIVSNLHMAYMTVGYDCPFVGERLQDSGIRQKCGVNIATIQRGATLIPVPSGDTRIFPGDVLGVIGTDDQIQQLLEIVEKDGEEATSVSPTDYKLTSLQLSESSTLVGKTVAESRLSTDYSTLLVSINRNEEFLTPAASTVFEPHDILWVVSTAKTIATLR